MAQFHKGDRMVGTSIASVFYNSSSSEFTYPQVTGYTSRTSSYGLRIEPTIGWFLSGKTAVGASMNIDAYGQKTRKESQSVTYQEDKVNNLNIGIGAFARHYFSAGNLMPYGHFGFNLGISSSTTEGFRYYDSSPDFKTTYDGKSSGGFFANTLLQAGLTKMLNPNTGLDFFAGYTYSYSKSEFKTESATDVDLDGDIDYTSTEEPTIKSTNHGFILGVGLQIFLRKK